MSQVREAILDRWAEGQTSPQIVEALNIGGVSADAYVRATVRRARQVGDHRAQIRGGAFRGRYIKVRMAITTAPARSITAEAARRGISPEALAAMVLVNVGEHDLFKAVLDD